MSHKKRPVKTRAIMRYRDKQAIRESELHDWQWMLARERCKECFGSSIAQQVMKWGR